MRVAIRFAIVALAAAQSAAAQPHGTLIYANTASPGTLDPPMALSTFEIETEHQIFEGLLAPDEHFQPVPMLAAKLEVNADATIFSFTLRHGVKFQNGKAMTAADVLASFQRYARISPNSAMLADVAGYDTPDPYIFVVRLKQPDAVFPNRLITSGYPLDIMPAEQLDKAPRDADIIGTGPFRLAEWQRDSYLLMRRYDGYLPDETQSGSVGYAGRKIVNIEAVRYNFVPEANSRVAALKSGEADIAAVVPPELIKSVEATPNLEVVAAYPGCMSVAFLHTQNPPTDNLAIRRAIAVAIDADEVIEGAGQIARTNSSLMYDDSPYYDKAVSAPYYNQKSAARAREFLAQGGYNGEKIVLQTNSTYAPMRDSTLVMLQQLKDAGMNAEVQVLDVAGNFLALQRGTKNWNVNLSWFCSQPLLGPQQWKPFFYNFASVKDDAALDDAFKRLAGSPKPEDRRRAWADAEHDVMDKAYLMKLSDFAVPFGYNDKKITGLVPWYTLRFWNVTIN